MHGEIRVTVIATGFDRVVGSDVPMMRPATPAAGVLNFPSTRQRPSSPGIQQPQPTPRVAPRVQPPPPTPGATEVPEMEIPTFIRRQMD
jgi:cell division protein FtsZ